MSQPDTIAPKADLTPGRGQIIRSPVLFRTIENLLFEAHGALKELLVGRFTSGRTLDDVYALSAEAKAAAARVMGLMRAHPDTTAEAALDRITDLVWFLLDPKDRVYAEPRLQQAYEQLERCMCLLQEAMSVQGLQFERWRALEPDQVLRAVAAQAAGDRATISVSDLFAAWCAAGFDPDRELFRAELTREACASRVRMRAAPEASEASEDDVIVVQRSRWAPARACHLIVVERPDA